MTIRLACATDIEAMASLHALCFEGGERWSAAQIASSLALPTTLALISEREGIEGFLLAQQAAGEAEILTLCVAQGARRHGAGKALVEAFLRQAQAAAFFLDVAQDNAPAHRLYESCGFTQVSRRNAYYKRETGEAVDALIYKRVL